MTEPRLTHILDDYEQYIKYDKSISEKYAAQLIEQINNIRRILGIK